MNTETKVEIRLNRDQLHDLSLCDHGVRDFHKSGSVCTKLIITFVAKVTGGLRRLLPDGCHDVFQFVVNLVPGPVVSGGILSHFQTGYGNTTGVGSLKKCWVRFYPEIQYFVENKGRLFVQGLFPANLWSFTDWK